MPPPDPKKNPELFDRYADTGEVVRWGNYGRPDRAGKITPGKFSVGPARTGKPGPAVVKPSSFGERAEWKKRYQAASSDDRVAMMRARNRAAFDAAGRAAAAGGNPQPVTPTYRPVRDPATGQYSWQANAGPEQSRGTARPPRSSGGNGLMMPRARRTMTGAHGMDRAMTDMTRESVPRFAGHGLMMRRSSRGAAEPAGTGPVSREAAPTVGGVPATADALPGVSGRMQTLLESDSPYLERARTRGLQHANRRGLLSSSIAAGASEAAAIDAALPIAQADANIAAGERAMRSQEFQQVRAIRSQELMQQRGFDHDAAQKEADRELSELLQARDHRVQQLMQTERLDHDAAQQQASRELQATLQRRAQAHASREAGRQREFAGDQAGLDRSQQRYLQRRTIESTEQLARDTAVRDINSEYQRQITALSLNTAIPVEERRALEDHYAFVRDQAMQSLEQIYGVELEWSSTQRPEEG